MSKKFLNTVLIFFLIIFAFPLNRSHEFARKDRRHNFELLSSFTCAVVNDELEKHPEMRTIAMVELKNDFPSNFSREISKCLPNFVAKMIMNPHDNFNESCTFMFPKESMIIYIADAIEKVGKLLSYS